MELKRTKEALENLRLDIIKKLQSNVPVDTGKLKSSIKIVMKKNKTPIFLMTLKFKDYGRPVHEGTKPHFVPVQKLKGWAKRHNWNVNALQLHISEKGTKPHPWIEYDDVVQKHLPLLTQAYILDVIQEIKQTLK